MNKMLHMTISNRCVLILAVLYSSMSAANDTAAIEALIARGELDRALTMTDELLAEDQYNVNYQFLKGLILTRQNQLESARDIFVSLTENHPELPEPFNNLAVVYAAMGDFTGARDALEKAIYTHPSYATAHENIGDIYAKMASNAYNSALELDDNNETAREKLSLISGLFSVESDERTAIVSTRREEIQEAEARLGRLQEDLDEISRRNQLQERRSAELQVELDSLETQRNDAISRTQQQRQQTLEQISQAEARLKQTREELARLEQQRTRINEELTLARARVEEEPEQPQADPEKVLNAVMDWAAYWSAKNLEGYLSSYSMSFVPANGISRDVWAGQREGRLRKPRYIQVEVADAKVTFMGDEYAQVNFNQGYKSDTYSDRVRKILLMKHENERWLIVEERSE